MLICVYRVNKAVRARLLVLVDLIDDQEYHTHQEGQGTDHQQGHLKEGNNSVYCICLNKNKQVTRLEQHILLLDLFFFVFQIIQQRKAAVWK